MRVRTDTDLLDIAPGDRADVVVDVINTGDVIDGVTARILGFPEEHVHSQPAMLPLFPESAGQLTLTLGLPQSFPAGRHPMTVEVNSRQQDVPPQYLDLDLVVPPVPGLTLTARPQVVRAVRSGRFVVTATNRGNTDLELVLTASDAERTVSVVLQPDRLRLPTGTAADVVVTLRGPRMILGTELDRPVTVTASVNAPAGPGTIPRPAPPPGSPIAPVPPTADDPESDGGPVPTLQEHVPLTLRQRPWFTRGTLTALILLAIIALWAAAFLFGIGQVFAGDPLTKQAPASFFAGPVASAAGNAGTANPASGAASGGTGTGPASGAAGQGAGQGAAGTGAAGTGAAGALAAPAPAGALAKSGVLPAGLGGTLSGTVVAASDGEPVGRILVEALRTDAKGQLISVASAASQADGSFQVAGLFPGTYRLRLSATGFKTITVLADPVTSGAVTSVASTVVTGDPATISGSVDPGDILKPVVSTVTVRPLAGPKQGTVVATAKTTATGSYKIAGLAAPGNYQLTFTTAGYLPSTVSTAVTGGAARIVPTVLLSAGAGTISGIVTDGTDPIGQVTVSTTVAGQAISTGTPTSGAVGTFTLDKLPTPATYVLTFSAAGFGQNTVVVDLGPGQSVPALKVTLAKGTTSVSGRLVDSTGAGIGGATVTVGGTADPPTTTTLTAGTVGAFSLDGLPSPGTYTLTFTRDGYATTTVPVELTGTGAAAPLTVTMPGALGRVSGRVLDSAGVPIIGASVVATDGRKSWPVMSTVASGSVPAGGYVIDKLPPGVYSVTATAANGVSRTAVLTVTAGATATVDFPIPSAG